MRNPHPGPRVGQNVWTVTLLATTLVPGEASLIAMTRKAMSLLRTMLVTLSALSEIPVRKREIRLL